MSDSDDSGSGGNYARKRVRRTLPDGNIHSKGNKLQSRSRSNNNSSSARTRKRAASPSSGSSSGSQRTPSRSWRASNAPAAAGSRRRSQEEYESEVDTERASSSSSRASNAPSPLPSDLTARRNAREDASDSDQEEDVQSDYDDQGNAQALSSFTSAGDSVVNSSVTTGDGRDNISIDVKKGFNTNAERLEAIQMARNLGIYHACIEFGVSEQTVRRWMKCEILIRQMDPDDSKYYVQHHTVPEELKLNLANILSEYRNLWPMDIQLVIRLFRHEARKMKLPHAAVPGIKAFLRTFKIEYQLHGAFVVQ